ncbi:MAG TPA: M20/M25/M40 family metallo-hydrolase [Anaerolineaceae bacterium]
MSLLPTSFVEKIIDLACAIQAIPAPTFNEGPRGAFFLEQFRALGLQDVHQDAAGNILGRIPGQYGHKSTKNRPVVVSAHMDTVHPLGTPLGARITDDRVTGPGIGDNALGLAALVALVQMLQQNDVHLPGDLWLAANVGEEGLGDLRGIKAIVDRFQSTPLAYLVVEGMGLGTVLHRGLGVERYRISIETPGGHSWVDYGQPSAIHELCALVTRLTAISLPQHPCTTMNVGVIHGGTSINTIAAHAWMELDLRSEDRATVAKVVGEVRALARNAQKNNVQVQMERIGRRLAGELPASHPLVELARSVITDLGMEPRLDIASTDANMPLSRGIPAVCLGITHGNNAHTLEEYILTAPIEKGLMQLYRITTNIWEKLK